MSRRDITPSQALSKGSGAASANTERPRFISKKERERLALERLAAKRQTETTTAKQAQEHRRAFMNGDKKTPERETPDVNASLPTYGSRELEMIKEHYLGTGSRKKRKVLSRDKTKPQFNFDWDESEDTVSDIVNPIYAKKHEANLGFGRGYIAGIDREAQRTTSKSKRQENTSLHWSDKKLEEMTDRDWRIFNEDHNIVTRGGSIPKPLRSWSEAEFLDRKFHQIFKNIGYEKPSPIQMQAIPIGIENRDCLGIAETGSGKTAAFLIPMMMYILNQPRMTSQTAGDGPLALVLAPTRELASQIHKEAQRFAEPFGIKTVAIIGGIDYQLQGILLRDGVDIVIATPGRMTDCLKKRYIVLNQCNYIVLDEADRMIDMGMQESVVEIMEQMPSSNLRPENPVDAVSNRIYRQTFLFSATMPVALEALAKTYLRNPAFVSIGDRRGVVGMNIQQKVVWTTEGQKRRLLGQVLQAQEPLIMIFLNQKKDVDSLTKHLVSEGFSAVALHGGKVQEQRSQALDGFRSGRYEILVATDVACRGIDVKGVKMVLNYDAPNSIQNYQHRIGRTGRAGESGTALTFLTAEDTEIMFDLKKLLIESDSPVPSELSRHEAAQTKPGIVSQGRSRSSQMIFTQ